MNEILGTSPKAFDLREQVAIATGSTQGLGEASARLLGMRGAAGSVLCGRNEQAGTAVAQSIAITGARAMFVRVPECESLIAITTARRRGRMRP
jgi:NAD(P)-dependent dehydrogenase (short-subunit alcohol dehydrogenase family)